MIPRICLAAGLLSLALSADDLEFGKDKITYSGSATKDDAQALGDALKKVGFFTDAAAVVLLNKSAAGSVITFIVQERRWRPELLMSFEQIIRGIAPAIGGLPVRVRMITNTAEFKTESNVLPVIAIGKDGVSPSGTASAEEAKALGDALKSDGYFQDRGVYVMLYKGDGPTTVTFIVRDQNIPNPAAYESILRDLAPSIGGLPIRLRIVNSDLEVKRQMIVRPALQVGQKDKLYYSDAATEAEARALAAALQTEGYFDDTGSVVLLYKGNEGAIVSFMLNSFDNPNLEKLYTQLGRSIAPAIGWLPLKIRLITTEYETKKEFAIQ